MNKRSSDNPLYRQVYEDLKKDICSGIYLPGDYLPPIREQAKKLSVARNTIESAYHILADEGFVSSKRGVGYMVLDIHESFNSFLEEAGVNREDSGSSGHSGQISFRKPFESDSAEESGTPSEQSRKKPLLCDFRDSRASSDIFPLRIWYKLAERLTGTESKNKESVDSCEIRSSIRRYLKKHRGIECRSEQIFLCRNVFEALQLIRLVHPYLLYTLPHHEGLLGNHIDEGESHTLLKRILGKDIYLVEDDLDSEIVYGRRPYAPLYTMNRSEQVIYTGTFDRLLAPWLQTQYVLFPDRLLGKVQSISKKCICRACHSELERVALTVFLQSRDWENYLRRNNHRCAERRNILIRALRNNFGESVVLHRTESGTEIIAAFPGSDFPYEDNVQSFCIRAEYAGLGIIGRIGKDTDDRKTLYLTMSYSALPETVITDGIRILKDLFR